MVWQKHGRLLLGIASAALALGLVVKITALLSKHAPPAPVIVDADESGRIPVLMYHSIGERNMPFDAHGINIPPETFRRQMEMLHDSGFYPINLRDLLHLPLAVPAGKMPVVITFDDARESQFRYTDTGTIDPDCAVGILDAMHQRYGDEWPQRAVFFVLPKSRYNPTPFRQAGQEKAKIAYLLHSGYEIANHSTSHRPMNRLGPKTLAWEVRQCETYFKDLNPGVHMETMAVPYGIFPKTRAGREALIQGDIQLVCMAWGDAAYSPYDRRFDPRAVPRIGSEPGFIERWIRELVAARTRPLSVTAPNVSDGIPDTLTVRQDRVNLLDSDKTGKLSVLTREPKTDLAVARK